MIMRIGLWCAGLVMFVLPVNAADIITPAEVTACTPDAVKLCLGEIGNSARLTACMKAKQDSISPACKAAFAKANGKGKPHVVAIPRQRPAACAPVACVPTARPVAAPVPAPPPSVLPPSPSSAEPTPKAIERHPMSGFISTISTMFVSWSPLIVLALIGWFIVKNGIPSVFAWFVRMWGYVSSGASDVKAAQTALAGEFAVLKTEVISIATHLISTGALPSTLAPTTTTPTPPPASTTTTPAAH